MSSRGWYRDFGRYDGPVDALDVINKDVPVTAEMYFDFKKYFRLWCDKLGLRQTVCYERSPRMSGGFLF